jgi:hypothetical protein
LFIYNQLIMAVLKKGKVQDLHFDDRNINKGTEYGMSLLGKSITETGMSRSLVADKNGVLIAGNKTLEAAVAAGIDKVSIVETDGKEIIVVQRKDLDINSAMGIKAKILDNTVSAHNYAEDTEVAEALCEEAEIVNTIAYGLNPRKDEDEEKVSFTATNKAIIKIEFPNRDFLAAAEKDLANWLSKHYPGAIISIKGK